MILNAQILLEHLNHRGRRELGAALMGIAGVILVLRLNQKAATGCLVGDHEVWDNAHLGGEPLGAAIGEKGLLALVIVDVTLLG